MPQFRFDSCVAFDGLTPDIDIRKVTFEPPLDVDQAENGFGYVTVNASFVETVENNAQDTWFDDVQGQTYTRIRSLISTDVSVTKMISRVVRAVSEQRNELEGDYELIVRILNADHNFTEDEAVEAGDILGLEGIHSMTDHFHPGRTHQEYEGAVKKLAACARVLAAENIRTATAEGNFGREQSFSLTMRGRGEVSFQIGQVTAEDLFILENSMTSITSDPNLAVPKKTISDDGEEIRIANLPRIIFDKVRTETNHLSVFSFAYIDTNMLRQEFNERLENTAQKLDFTFSNVSSAIVQSDTFIPPPVSTTAEDALSPDTNNTSPQANIFQDLRGIFAASNRTLGGPDFATDTASSSGVSLAGFEDEISAMSVDVNEQIRDTLARQATVFSDLWLSRRRSDAIDLSFAFNERVFLKQSSIFPKLYDNQRFSYLLQGLGGGISRIRVYKQLVNPNLVANENSLNTTSRSSLMLGRNQEKEYISVGPRNEILINDLSDEIYFGANGEKGSLAMGLKFLTCTDYENENARNTLGATYRYGVEIDYVDPTVDMVLRMTNGLLEQAQILNDIANDLGTMPSTTPKERTDLHISTEARCNSVLDTWLPLLNDLSTLDIVQGAGEIGPYLTQLKGDDQQTVYERAEGIIRIADVFEFYGSELEIELRKAIPGIEVYPGDDSPEAANYASSAGSGAGGTARSINSIDHVFKKTVPADQQAGYDYLRYDPIATQNPGLEVVTLSDFVSRCDIETEKYYNDSIGVSGLTTTKVKYFTPAVILDPLGKALVQSSETISDYEKYIDFTAGIISYKSQKPNGIVVNNNRLGSDAEIDTEQIFIQELQNLGVSIDFNTDKNRSKDPLVGKSPFSVVALGSTKKSDSDINQEDLKDRDNILRDKRGEEQERRDGKSKSKNLQKGLSNLVGSLALSSDKSGLSDGKSNSFTKVVLDTPEREFDDLSFFPNQLKAMVNIVLSRYNQNEEEYQRYNYDFEEIRPLIGPNNQQAGLTDPMRDYSRFASYWLNYKQIKKIEILAGFGTTSSDQINIAAPSWKEIRLEDINTLPRRSVLLCRFSPLTGDLVEMLGLNAPSGLDLPTYNQYFLLTRTDEEADLRIIQEEIAQEPEPEPEQQFQPPPRFQPTPSVQMFPPAPQIQVEPEVLLEPIFPRVNIIPKIDLPQIVLPKIPRVEQVMPKVIAPRPIVPQVIAPPNAPRPTPARQFEDLIRVVNKIPDPAPRVRQNNLERIQSRPGQFAPQLPRKGQSLPNQGRNTQRSPQRQRQPQQQARPRGQRQVQQNVRFNRTQVQSNVPRAGMGNFGRGVARNVSRNVGRNIGGGGGLGGY